MFGVAVFHPNCFIQRNVCKVVAVVFVCSMSDIISNFVCFFNFAVMKTVISTEFFWDPPEKEKMCWLILALEIIASSTGLSAVNIGGAYPVARPLAMAFGGGWVMFESDEVFVK